MFYDHIVLEFRDTRSMHQLAPFYNHYLPWSGASIRPTTLVYILNDIMLHDRKVIVECGSGISTLFIAGFIKKTGRKIAFYSIDHDGYWQDIIKEEVNRQGLSDCVQCIHAPLAPHSLCWGGRGRWYDTAAIEASFSEPDIDLLIVDGPPANKKGLEFSRYPAVPFFRPGLKGDYKVILDDAGRSAERKISQEWGKMLNTKFKQDLLNGNVFVAGSGAFAYNV
ncbi:MAG: hypothetical protein WD272_02630 [Balneolales bacterium]